jgi:hypothetical protein
MILPEPPPDNKEVLPLNCLYKRDLASSCLQANNLPVFEKSSGKITSEDG